MAAPDLEVKEHLVIHGYPDDDPGAARAAYGMAERLVFLAHAFSHKGTVVHEMTLTYGETALTFSGNVENDAYHAILRALTREPDTELTLRYRVRLLKYVEDFDPADYAAKLEALPVSRTSRFCYTLWTCESRQEDGGRLRACGWRDGVPAAELLRQTEVPAFPEGHWVNESPGEFYGKFTGTRTPETAREAAAAIGTASEKPRSVYIGDGYFSLWPGPLTVDSAERMETVWKACLTLFTPTKKEPVLRMDFTDTDSADARILTVVADTDGSPRFFVTGLTEAPRVRPHLRYFYGARCVGAEGELWRRTRNAAAAMLGDRDKPRGNDGFSDEIDDDSITEGTPAMMEDLYDSLDISEFEDMETFDPDEDFSDPTIWD